MQNAILKFTQRAASNTSCLASATLLS